MAGVNKVILIGNLGKDPEVRTFDSGTKKAAFSLATSEPYTDKSGEKKDRIEWHNVVFWGKIADVVEKYLKKGNQVYIEGRIASRSYDDKDGIKRYITEIEGTNLTMIKTNKTESEGTVQSEPSGKTVIEAGTGEESQDLPF